MFLQIRSTSSQEVITPELYPLGKLEIEQQGIPTFVEARNWFVAVDPQFVLESNVSPIATSHMKSQQRTVSVNSTHQFEFFMDGGDDLHYKYTSNGGSSWTDGGDIQTGTFLGVSVWYEPWTPGLTNQTIHIAVFDGNPDKIYYTEFNPRVLTGGSNPVHQVGPFTDTVINENSCSSSCLGRLTSANDVTITVGADNTIYAGTVDVSNPKPSSSIRQCSSNCSTSAGWSSLGSGPWGGSTSSGEDSLILLPLANNDIMLVTIDDSDSD